jgi:uncharacterized membrane protein
MTWTALLPTIAAAFLASLVEVVEAFTIVLAVGVTQGWRPALMGSGMALGVLVLIVLIFGPLLALIPIAALQFTVGSLLILFGLRWLRKAILRSAGWLALRDEAAAFAKEANLLQAQAAERKADVLAGLAAFKAVLLEGVEVVFIVIAVGTAHGQTFWAGMGALAAVILVLLVGAAVHKPLVQVPENTLKFIVGLMLSAFGVFWTGEGLGAHWPGGDLALIWIFAVFAVFAMASVRYFIRPQMEGV